MSVEKSFNLARAEKLYLRAKESGDKNEIEKFERRLEAVKATTEPKDKVKK